MKKRELIGYGAATIADAAPYNFVTVYLILFLTTIAGLSPEKAGTVSSVIILANGITGAFIGCISDHTKSKYGRRRPYILAGMFPLAIGLSLLFTSFQAGTAFQTAFYIFAGLMFWTGFSTYYTPYTALGAELTSDYNERSVLRTIARFFGIGGNLIGSALPLAAVGYLKNTGMTDSSSWFAVAVFVAVISGTGIAVTWRTTRGKENPSNVIEGKLSLRDVMGEYVNIFRLKPFRYIIGIVAAFIIANTFYNSSMVFFARYSLGISDGVTSSIFMISIAANLVYTPVIGFCAVKFGKKATVAVSMLISGFGGIIFYICGIDSYFKMGLYTVIFSLSYTCYWQLINALLYDISEVAEYKIGRRLEGTISSATSLVFTCFTSVAAQLLGWVLKFGFTDSAYMLMPGVFLCIAAVIQLKYPVNKESFNKLAEALSCKKAGKPVDEHGLERII
ncbi:MAG: MFS transporter [Bacillota bacterium]|nr:MFS transporter [Bacillota bacterium]